ncbi:hypothetical protein GCM10018987_14660 [Streptomyces cremeus]
MRGRYRIRRCNPPGPAACDASADAVPGDACSADAVPGDVLPADAAPAGVAPAAAVSSDRDALVSVTGSLPERPGTAWLPSRAL